MSTSPEQDPPYTPTRRRPPQKNAQPRRPNLYDLLPLYFSPVGVTWLRPSNGEPPPETPSGIAAKLFELAVQPQTKDRGFRLTRDSDDTYLLADAGRRAIRAQFHDETDQGLLIRASLKLRRQLVKATGWAVLGVMPLALTAVTIIVMYGAGRGRGSQSALVIGATVVLWAVQVVAVAVAVLTQIAETPLGRRFLPFRWLALAPVFHAFLASRWLMLLTVLLAYGHSWFSLGCVLAVMVTGILASTYTRAYLLKPVGTVVLEEPEREALREWCAEGKIAPPGPETMQPASFFRSQGRWVWWRIGALAAWFLAMGFASQLGTSQIEVVFLGLVPFVALYFLYLAGFHILARINPYDRPSGLFSTVTGAVFFFAAYGALLPLFPPAPRTPTAPASLPRY